MCFHFGILHVKELGKRLSGEEYLNWKRYYNTEPFGFPRADAKHGELMSNLWALLGGQRAPENLKSSVNWQYRHAYIDEEGPELDEETVRAKLGV